MQEQVVVPPQVLALRRQARAWRQERERLRGLASGPELLRVALLVQQARVELEVAQQAQKLHREAAEQQVAAQLRIHRELRAQALGLALV